MPRRLLDLFSECKPVFPPQAVCTGDVPIPDRKALLFSHQSYRAILLAHRLGLVTGGLDPNLIFTHLDTMQVKLAGCEQFQIADMAAIPSFAQFAASSRLTLLAPRADTRPLALLAAQILSRGTASVPDSSLLGQSMVDTLTQIIQGRQSCSVRQLLKVFIHALNGRTRLAAPPISFVPAPQTPPTVYVCKDYGTNFTITPGEQQFYESKGFELPQRCPACRRARAGRSTSVSSSPGPAIQQALPLILPFSDSLSS